MSYLASIRSSSLVGTSYLASTSYLPLPTSSYLLPLHGLLFGNILQLLDSVVEISLLETEVSLRQVFLFVDSFF